MRLSNVFGDFAVLQAEKPCAVWGFASPREEIEITLTGADGKKTARHCTAADDGRFTARFPSFPAGNDAYTLECAGASDAVRLHGVVFGEVLLAAGQSNMQYSAGCVENRAELAESMKNPYLRYVNIYTDADANGAPLHSKSRLNELKHSGWEVLNDVRHMPAVSAIAYMTALRIYEERNVPIGILNAAVGGSAVHEWLPPGDIKNDKALSAYIRGAFKWIADGQEYAERTNPDTMPSIFKEKIAPLAGLAMRCVLWCQGENSAAAFKDAAYHKRAMRALIKGYRRELADPVLPFVLIHIAAFIYEPDYFSVNYINEGLDEAAARLKNVYSVPVYDVHPSWLVEDGGLYYHPIHPTNKKEIAARAADTALNRIISVKPYGFAEFASIEPSDSGITVKFKNAFGGLRTSDGKSPRGFAIGKDGVYYGAEAAVTGADTVRLTSKRIDGATDACYAFYLYNGQCNLTNGLGLPVKPFRTVCEDASVRAYYTYENYTHNEFKQWECNYFPENGGAFYAEPWKSVGNAVAEAEDGALKLTYTPANERLYFFGAAPNISYTGAVNHFLKRGKIFFEVRAAAGRVSLYGLQVKTRFNKRFMLRPAGAYPLILEPSDNFTAIELPLNRFHAQWSDTVPCAEDLGNVQYAELVFQSQEPCVLYIKSFMFI